MPIEVNNITYTYMKGTPFERKALEDVSFSVEDGEFLAIAGHTGSGKSTLAQLISGLIEPMSGSVRVDGEEIFPTSKSGKEAAWKARRKIGMVFQYPEHQLFEETVGEDISFGPRNMGLNETEISVRVTEAMLLMGLDPKSHRDADPFEMSGGQKRRVAIAGVLAMRPKYLVLDEPAAGLDPQGRESMMQEILGFRKKRKTTIVLITHNMDDIARFADRAMIMHQGKCILQGIPKEVFKEREILAKAGLRPPGITCLLELMRQRGIPVKAEAVTMEKGTDEILEVLRSMKNGTK